MISINDLSSEEGSGTEQATSKVESPPVVINTQISRHGTTPQMRQNQRFLRLLELFGILLREEYKRARALGENENMELQERVRRLERALGNNEVPSTEQMRAWALRLVGVNNGISETAKSQLTLAFQTHFMLVRAARRAPPSLFERFNIRN